MKKKIGIVTTWYPPPYAEFIQHQAETLNKTYDVTVFYFKFSIIPSSKMSIENGLKVWRITFPYLPKKTNITMEYWANMAAQYIVKVHKKEGFHILHAHNYLSGFIAGKVYDKTGLNFINTLHNSDLVDKSYNMIVKRQLKKNLPKAKRVICVSQSQYDAVNDTFDISSNGAVVPNMVDTSKFTIDPFKEEPFKFIVIGAVYRNKRIPEILSAFKRIKNSSAQLYVVGDVYEKIDENLISDNTIFHSNISNDDLPNLLRKCHCLITFSIIETFGITVIEAMSCGLPVIYSASGGPEGTVPDWAGINVGHSIDKLSIAMDDVIDHYSTYKPQKIRAYTIENYSFDVVASQLQTIIED